MSRKKTRPVRLIIGSSTEGLAHARALKKLLMPEVEATLWSEDFFTPGELTLETLEERSRTFDGAVVVATADDRVVARGKESDAVRDNLLFEFGLFVAMFGRRRALMLVEGLGSTKLPSDMLGLTCIGFKKSKDATTAISSAADKTKLAVSKFADEVVDRVVADRLEELMRVFIGDLQAAIGVTSDLGLHTWIVDERASPPKLVRVARGRNSPKAALSRQFARGKGLVGHCWSTNMAVFVDLDEEPYASATEAEWKSYGTQVARGMSYSLLVESRSRYRLVGAVPLVSELATGLRFLGCVSYNVGRAVSVEGVTDRVPEVQHVLERAAEVVRIVLESQ